MSGFPTLPAGLAALAQQLPCRVYCGTKGPYLSRYTLAERPDGGCVYLHFFHRGDADCELHNHPWRGTSLVLFGGYVEERRVGSSNEVVRRIYLPGEENTLTPDTFHRVDLIDDSAGCWTLFTVGARVQEWGFWDRYTGAFTPWREHLVRNGLATP